MRKFAKNLRKGAPRGPSWTGAAVSASLSLPFGKIPCQEVYHAGGSPPMLSGDPRALRPLRGDTARPLASMTHCIDPKLLKPCPNFTQTTPKPYQNPSKTHPKSTPNRSQRPLEDNLGPMLLKNSILNGQITTKRHPKGAKRRPRSSQSPPKLSPRPSQIQF